MSQDAVKKGVVLEIDIRKQAHTEDMVVFKAIAKLSEITHFFVVTFFKNKTKLDNVRWKLFYEYTISLWESTPDGKPNYHGTLFTGPSNHPTQQEAESIVLKYLEFNRADIERV